MKIRYYYILSTIPIYVPAAVDPLVAILTIKSYRHSAMRLIGSQSFLRIFPDSGFFHCPGGEFQIRLPKFRNFRNSEFYN